MTKKSGTVLTTWEVRTYDVWGNAEDGFEVNDTYVVNRNLELWIPVTIYNQGTEQEFRAAFPSDKQLREVFGLGKSQIETDGDDLSIYVTRARDSFPVGELYCKSHESLSPIRKRKAA